MFALALAFAVIVTSPLPSVRAHGYVQDVVVGSTHYTGYLPYTDPYYNPVPQRIIRKIPGNGRLSFCYPMQHDFDYCLWSLGPVQDVTLIEYVFLFCHKRSASDSMGRI